MLVGPPRVVSTSFKYSTVERRWCLCFAWAVLAVVAIVNVHFEVTKPCDRFAPSFAGELAPRLVHQFWKTHELDSPRREWSESIRKQFPAPRWEYRLWNDTELDEFMRREYPEYVNLYEGYEFQIQRVDVARYFVLHKYGGLYLDLDFEVFDNFWFALDPHRVSFVESPFQYVGGVYTETRQNSLMSSPPGNPFWLGLFSHLETVRNRGVFSSTGPAAIDSYVASMREYEDDSFPALLPCTHFNRMYYTLEHAPGASAIHRHTLGRITTKCKCAAEKIYTKHHATGSYVNDTGVMRLFV